ncbi:MAG: SMP-30/gluconolactonase/LRE family protein [Acidobacteriota bacterium]
MPSASQPFTLALFTLLLTACQPSPDPPPTQAEAPAPEPAEVIAMEVHDPAFHSLVPEDLKLEVLGEGYSWSEGPVWVADGDYLLFSDVPQNVIYRWHETDGVQPWIRPSGYTGSTPREGEPGSNGLVIDAEGRLLLCQHGDRRVARLAQPLAELTVDTAPGDNADNFETVADRFDGKRFNSPNDLVLHPSGDLYFTDPPYGLVGGADSPDRELDHYGVYRIATDGSVTLLHDQLSRPNGIALSPDGTTLYVANSDPQAALWMAWTLGEDGTLSDGRVLHDATSQVSDERPGLPDGMKIDADGNLFATGPGGIWVFSADGKHLGTLRLPDPTANCAFGEDGRSLFVTSNHRLLRVRLNSRGLGFDEPPAS